MTWAALTVAAYLLGSIPFGLLIARAHGVDLRRIGSGNIGATNVSRALGRPWAMVCFAFDCLKGLVPMLVAALLIDQITVGVLWLWLGVGCAAIIGHVFPVYLRFRGGKGAATSLGVIFGLYPYLTLPGLVILMIWSAVLITWRYVSLASILAALSFPVVLAVAICIQPDWHFAVLWPLLIVACAISILVIVRHVENIKRLLEGSESKAFQN
ncbi:MAG TPA: glycerol-3-phosphate 1-O-acyltransferase PlsY [Anaerohalosphaeraceae bacterium]|jgi:glycerol-3-phosphate acyltransferase PlsY|nr:glycerol-3-phosphate 1-O-acyltransferase PlsY [Anaerohalosphaeraceae bacterium]HRT49128.1 glycerol-3-phosphate 1-O-acyltransferase PlsY [Anaerohalosphaeraceae bacterium]HRT85619.1 glycerol-3-phosphate 1-O-acyltransferase PlsY [Anaerohalosphaeraceae bacterium]